MNEIGRAKHANSQPLASSSIFFKKQRSNPAIGPSDMDDLEFEMGIHAKAISSTIRSKPKMRLIRPIVGNPLIVFKFFASYLVLF